MKTSGTTRDNEWQRVIKNDKEWQQLKSLNSGHLWVLKNLSVIKRYPLLGGSLTKIVIFGTKHFVHYSRHDCYLGCPAVGEFHCIYRRAPLIEAGTSAQHQLFQKSHIFEKPTFPESYLFRVANFSKDFTFYSSNLFRRAIFHSILFQKSCYFIATFPLHSYSYYLSASNWVSAGRVTYT